MVGDSEAEVVKILGALQLPTAISFASWKG
jgi:hypothetical protein